ncbi:MAG: helix-turn-helix domain-containing protein [Vicinamibacterales bacterium]
MSQTPHTIWNHVAIAGAALRDAREQRGLSLDQLAQATKIRVTTLQAIETNRREKLPEAIFLRGGHK